MAGEGESSKDSGTYYLDHRQEITAAFQASVRGAELFWEPEFGPERTRAMAEEALDRFERLLPELPDVGGEKNWCAQFIPLAAWYVALYPPMKANGKTAEDVGKLVYELMSRKLQATPREEAFEEGEKMFSPESVDKMRKWAEWTQEREYPSNWVTTFVPGNGEEFDWGYDYTQCGVVEFFKARGVPELAPYLCLCDFPRSAALGSGLRRAKTLAQGDALCDFRYKKGRPVVQDWSTEIALIRSRTSR